MRRHGIAGVVMSRQVIQDKQGGEVPEIVRRQSCITAGKAGLSADLDASFVRYVQSVLRLTLSEKFVLKNFVPRACDGGNTKG